MTHEQLMAVYRQKASRAETIASCDHAIADIVETLKLWPTDERTPYTRQLECEMDAFIERRQSLQAEPSNAMKVEVLRAKLDSIKALASRALPVANDQAQHLLDCIIHMADPNS